LIKYGVEVVFKPYIVSEVLRNLINDGKIEKEGKRGGIYKIR